jgi:hypothetical protein
MVPVIFTEETTRVTVDAAGGWPNTNVIAKIQLIEIVAI